MKEKRKYLVWCFVLAFVVLAKTTYAQFDIASKTLLQRVVPAHASQFNIEPIKPINNKDVFEIESHNNKIVLRGNNGVAIASALYYYLNRFCYAQITWNGINMKL